MFKSRYERFRCDWAKKFGWDLFKPLHAADAHTFDTLHVPSDDNQAEFDNQTMSLAKVLIERINDAGLQNHIEAGRHDKSIAKLEKYLQFKGFLADGHGLDFLRRLQDLRSGPAHVKGTSYEKAAKYFQVGKKGTIELLAIFCKLQSSSSATWHNILNLAGTTKANYQRG